MEQKRDERVKFRNIEFKVKYLVKSFVLCFPLRALYVNNNKMLLLIKLLIIYCYLSIA